MQSIKIFVLEYWQTILLILSYLIVLIIKIIKSIKTKKMTLETVLNEIIVKVPNYIKEAESTFIGHKQGFSKLLYVLKKIQNDCHDKKIRYDESYFTDVVEELLTLPTKNN